MSFFVDDGVYLGQKGNGLVGPVMHHGIKNGNDVEHHYFQPLDIISRLAREWRQEMGERPS